MRWARGHAVVERGRDCRFEFADVPNEEADVGARGDKLGEDRDGMGSGSPSHSGGRPGLVGHLVLS